MKFNPAIHSIFITLELIKGINQKTVWYGSINLLSFGYSEESVMRIVSASIAAELMASLAV